MNISRDPPEDSYGLYPGLVVGEEYAGGSIRIGGGRLPLWALVSSAVGNGWDDVKENWPTVDDYGYTKEKLGQFLHDLLEARGEFGRLLLVLADAQRNNDAWWNSRARTKPVRDQLQRCIDTLKD